MDGNISADLQAEIESPGERLCHRARVTGQTLDDTEARAIKAWYAADTDRIFIELNTEIIMGFPAQRLQGLGSATPRQLVSSGRNYAIWLWIVLGKFRRRFRGTRISGRFIR
jgi:hypothetical protein